MQIILPSAPLIVSWRGATPGAPLNLHLRSATNNSWALVLGASVAPGATGASNFTGPAVAVQAGDFYYVSVCVAANASACFFSAAFSLVAGAAPDEVAVVASLMSFYRSLGGPGWKRSDGWGSQLSVCFWYGIYCGAASPGGVTNALVVVEVITISENRLMGRIEQGVGNLTAMPGLLKFDISFNALNGCLPSLGRFPSLQEIELYNNALTCVARDAFAENFFLLQFYLDNNYIAGELPELGGCPFLQTIESINNAHSGALPDFANNSQLVFVYLSTNQFTALPASFPQVRLEWVMRDRSTFRFFSFLYVL